MSLIALMKFSSVSQPALLLLLCLCPTFLVLTARLLSLFYKEGKHNNREQFCQVALKRVGKKKAGTQGK